MKEFLKGDTFKMTWVNSGVTPDSSITGSIWNADEIAVDSFTLSDSGNGHWYGLYTLPTTPGYYRAVAEAIIDSKPYIREERFRIKGGEV